MKLALTEALPETLHQVISNSSLQQEVMNRLFEFDEIVIEIH